MSFERKTKDGFEVFVLKNKNGMVAEILSIGAAITALMVPDKNGKLRDVVLGFEKPAEYLKSGPKHGAVCGRFANRIENAEFTIDGKTYKLPPNYQGKHVLHGGSDKPCAHDPFEYKSNTENSVTLTKLLPDGENGFPGNLTVDVTYTLSDENGLKISYLASCDSDTVMNFTNHAYFNLRGHDAGDIYDHVMTMYSDTYAPLAENGMVYGALLPLPEEFDFRAPKAFGKDINRDHAQLNLVGGYDHAWTVRNEGKMPVVCTEVYCPESGINMTVRTNSPTVLLYTANGLKGDPTETKGGAAYGKHTAFCLETGFYPNCVKFPEFGQGIYRKGEVFDYETEYVFDIK